MALAALGIGTAIAIDALGVAASITVIANALQGLLPTHRQALILIQNHCTDHDLVNPHMYIFSGHNYKVLPNIEVGKQTTLLFTKTPHSACGAVAVLTYDLVNQVGARPPKRFAIMFSVPYDFNLYSNWFAVGLYPISISTRSKRCNYDLYKEMYYNDFHQDSEFQRKRGGQPLTFKRDGFRVEASMSDTYQPNIVLKVYDGRRPGDEFHDGRGPEMEFHDERGPGMEFHDERGPGMEFHDERRHGMELK